MTGRPRLPTVVTWSVALVGIGWIFFTMVAAHRVGGADAPHLVSTELRLAQLVLDGHPVQAVQLWWALLVPHPPIGALPGWLVATLTLGDPRAAHLTMALALVASMDAYVRLARVATGRSYPSAAAIAVLLSSPFTWSSAEQYGRDVFVGVAVLQALSWAAAGLGTPRHAWAFGVAMGAAFGSKYTAPMFLVGPCVLLGVWLLSRREPGAWRGLGRAILAFMAVAGVWYLSHLSGVRGYLSHSVDTGAVAKETASLKDLSASGTWAYYPAALWEALSGPGVLLVLVGVVVGFIGRQSRLSTSLLCASALGGLGILMRVPLQVDRYVFPVTVLAAGALLPLARSRGVLALILAFSVPRFWASADRFRPGRPGRDEDFDHGAGAFGSLQFPIATSAWFPANFSPAAWNLDAAVIALQKVAGNTGTIGLVVPSTPGWPGFGHLVVAAAAHGAHWDWATVNLRGGMGPDGKPAPAAFIGPLFDEAAPPPTFHHALAFSGAGTGAIEQWLTAHHATEEARLTTPRGVTVLVVAIP